MRKTIGEVDLTSNNFNETEEVQGEGCRGRIFTKTREKRRKMMENAFQGLDLMGTFFGNET